MGSGVGWRVKYDGTCSRCGLVLRVGDVAVHERATRSIRCVECPTTETAPIEPLPIDAGVAGGSARREHERLVAKRDAAARERWGNRLGGVVLALTDEPHSTRAWAIGARGEEKLAEALEGVEGLRALHDRRVPRSKRNIDHVLIAPAGIFVVDAKHYKGTIEIRNKGWFLRPDYRLYVGRRDCSHLAEGLGWQIETIASALAAAGVDPMPPIIPVLCFVDGDWPLFGAPNEFRGVRLESERSLRRMLSDVQRLEETTIDRLAQILARGLPSK